jgi:WD40 repeat protein
VYDLETGQKVMTLWGHKDTVFSCTFSPDGQRVLTGSFDRTARVWDKSATNVLVLTNSDGVADVAFSPDGRVVATACLSEGLKLWDARSGDLLPKQFDLGQSVTALAFSPDGERLAYASGPFVFDNDADATVHVINLSNRQRWGFVAHRSMIVRVRFSPDGRCLATASCDGSARVWDAVTGTRVLQLEAVFNGDPVRGVAFSPDGKWLAACGAGWLGGAKIFEVQTGRLVRSLDGHSIGVTGVAFSSDGTRLSTASYDRTARVWSAAAQPEFLSLEGHDQPVWTIAFSRDGTRLASGSLDQTARVWDTETGCLLTTVNVAFPVVSLTFSPDARRLVTVAADHTAKVWNVTNGQPILGLSGHSGTVMAVAWSPDGRRILTGSKDNTARLWDANTGVLERTIAGHTHWVLGVTFSPDSRRFATGSGDNTARVWEVETGRPLRILRGHSGWVQQVAFSPDGRQVATGCEDQFARLFDAETGRLLRPPMEGHRAGVSALAFSPDGTRLATAGGGAAPLGKVYGYDRSTILWDLRTGQRLLKLDAHSSWVLTVAFSPDGKRLATGSLDNTIRIREAFPWKSEDYSGAVNMALAEKVEAFKRCYWREGLRRDSWTIPLGTRPVKPGRRLDLFHNFEVNLPAQPGAKSGPATAIPPRGPNAGANLVDLAPSYNMTLAETWQPILGLDDLDSSFSSLPAGVQVLAAVPFDVRGIIRLARASYGYAVFPTNVQIAVGRRFHRLHVLHGTESRAPDGTQIGAYRLHYREGAPVELKIVYGRDVLGWKAFELGAPQGMEAEVAWTGTYDQTQPTGRKARLYKRTYENPAPGREVARITFESAMTASGPFLLALTVEP